LRDRLLLRAVLVVRVTLDDLRLLALPRQDVVPLVALHDRGEEERHDRHDRDATGCGALHGKSPRVTRGRRTGRAGGCLRLEPSATVHWIGTRLGATHPSFEDARATVSSRWLPPDVVVGDPCEFGSGRPAAHVRHASVTLSRRRPTPGMSRRDMSKADRPFSRGTLRVPRYRDSMKRFSVIVALAAVMATAAVAGGAVSRPSITVTPTVVERGHDVLVRGSAAGCPKGDAVTLLSRAFVHTHDFAGVSAVYARVN